jgi:hypothetical protein
VVGVPRPVPRANALLQVGVSVFGMLAIVGLVESTTVVPSSRFEWQEAIEYAAGIMLATAVGSALAGAIGAARSAIGGH